MSSASNKYITNEEAVPIATGTGIFAGHENERFALGVFSPQSVLSYKPNSPEELYLKLRSNVYVKRTGMLPDDVIRQDGTELDENDERSTHFVIFENRNLGRVAAFACMRLIEKGNDGSELPIEDFFKGELKNTSFVESAPPTSVEVSRFIVCHDNIRQSITSKQELMAAGLSHTVSNNLGPILGVVEPVFERDLKIMRIPVERIADPKLVPEYNDTNLGIEINKERFVKRLGKEILDRMSVPVGSFGYWGEMPVDTDNHDI